MIGDNIYNYLNNLGRKASNPNIKINDLLPDTVGAKFNNVRDEVKRIIARSNKS